MSTITLTYAQARPAGIVDRARRYLAARKVANTVYAELSALSDRDLADIGLSRENLRDVARKAAAAA